VAKWYVLHTASGGEKIAKQQILEQAAIRDMLDLFEEIIIPVVKIPESKRGKKVITEKKIMPGYIFIKMDMNDEAWHLVKNIPKITNFLGSKNAPQEISQAEMDRVLAQEISENQNVVSEKAYEIGETVRIIDGPFNDFIGTIEKIDLDRRILKLSTLIFGKPTPVELGFDQVKKETK
jgi:transcription termination/antitermination protein NusG